MEDEATTSSDEVYLIGQLRRAKARALAAMGRQDKYDVTATVPVDLSEFSYRLPHELNKGQSKPPGHSEVLCTSILIISFSFLLGNSFIL